ncbi:MAG: phosphohydrolase, partial [Raoultibacter sp.]
GIVESCYVDQSTIKTLRPSTLEGCVVRVSDMIAYLGKDRQDAIDMGVLNSLSGFDTNVIGRGNAQIINNLTVDIVNNSYRQNRIAMSKAVFDDIKRAKSQNYEQIYFNEGVIAGYGNVVGDMFAEMYGKLLGDLVAHDESSPIFRHHIASLEARSRTVRAQDYLAEEPNQIVVDYMASMTDNYFTTLYEFLFPKSDKQIITQDYCSDLRSLA